MLVAVRSPGEERTGSTALRIAAALLAGLLLLVIGAPAWALDEFAYVTLGPLPPPPGPPHPSIVTTSPVAGTLVAVGSGAGGSEVDHVVAASSEGTLFELAHDGRVLASGAVPGNPVALRVRPITPVFVYVATLQGGVYRLDGSLNVVSQTIVPGTPVGITWTPANRVFVATAEGGVHSFDEALGGHRSTTVSGSPVSIGGIDCSSPGCPDWPVTVVTDEGQLHVLSSSLAASPPHRLSGTPIALARGRTGHGYVVTAEGSIVEFDSSGRVVHSLALGTPLVAAHLDGGSYVTVADRAGRVYVTDVELTGDIDSVATGIPLASIATDTQARVFAVGGIAPALGTSSANLGFPSTPAGKPSAPQTLTLVNDGNVPITHLRARVAAPPGGPALFDITSPPDAVLAPGGTTSLDVRFLAPSRAGVSESTLEIGFRGGPTVGSRQVRLTGESAAPVQARACYSTQRLAFGDLTAGDSATRTFSVTSCGTGSLRILSTDVAAGRWSLTPTVPPAILLPPGDSRTFSLTLGVPSNLATETVYRATVTIATDDEVDPTVRTVTAEGRGLPPRPEWHGTAALTRVLSTLELRSRPGLLLMLEMWRPRWCHGLPEALPCPSFGASFELSPRETTPASGSGTDVDVFDYGPYLLLELSRGPRFRPYLVAGVGGVTYAFEGQGSTTRAAIDFGGGLGITLHDRLMLRLDVRDSIHGALRLGLPREGVADPKGTEHDLSLSVGLSFRFY